MSEQESRERGEEARPGEGGLGDLSMNVVPSAITQEASEARPRAGARWLLLIAVLVVVGALAYGAQKMLNMPPGQDAELQLKSRIERTEAWRMGAVMGVSYISGDRIRVDFGSGVAHNPTAMRTATIEVMKAFIAERPGRDLHIDGYSGGGLLVKGEYRQKGGVQVAGGEVEPDITVRVEGESGGGIKELVEPTDRTVPGG